MQLWRGQRNFVAQDSLIYSVRNDTYHTDVEANLDNVEDEQVNVLTLNPAQMSDKAKLWPGRAVLKLVGQALGASVAQSTPAIGNPNAFDGLPFFGNRVAGGAGYGVGNNLLSYNSASNDGLTYNLVALFYGNTVLKPLCWQLRSGPDFRTNAGDVSSYKSRVVQWWVDLRGAPFFSWWFNAVGVQITNTPNVAEMHAIYSLFSNAFASFKNPIVTSTDDGEFIHEQTVFDSSNLYLVGSAQLREQLRQSVAQDWIPQNIGNNTVATTSTFKGWAKWTVSNYLNNF